MVHYFFTIKKIHHDELISQGLIFLIGSNGLAKLRFNAV